MSRPSTSKLSLNRISVLATSFFRRRLTLNHGQHSEVIAVEREQVESYQDDLLGLQYQEIRATLGAGTTIPPSMIAERALRR
jgi:hypothetical protein